MRAPGGALLALSSFRFLRMRQSVSGEADDMRKGWSEVIHDSPIKSHGPIRAMVASLPRVDRTVSFALPS
jgi:hypothetical protein